MRRGDEWVNLVAGIIEQETAESKERWRLHWLYLTELLRYQICISFVTLCLRVSLLARLF